MKDYKDFTANDFILDSFFEAWIMTPDEHSNAFWEQWLKDHPEKAADVEEAKSLMRHLVFSNHALSEKEISDLWVSIKSFDSKAAKHASGARPVIQTWFKIAASFVLCALVYYAYSLWNDNSFFTYHTAYGETKTIVLPDSSTVILNSNSILRFPNDWDQQSIREIWLEGEAFFSVVHKTNNQPFRVYTDEGVNVEVLGTTFNVYHRTAETKIVLNTGKIRLHLPSESAAQGITMKPGDFVEYKEKSFSRRIVNPAIYTAWTEKKLILDHTSLREMVAMLRDNYGVEVAVASDTLLNQTVSGSMPLDDVESLVNQIAQTFQLKIVKRRNKFLMYE